MEKIINNPGHQNITENIFLNLDYEDLEACGLINKSCNRILDDPFFWLKKYPLSKKNQDDWDKSYPNVEKLRHGKKYLLVLEMEFE